MLEIRYNKNTKELTGWCGDKRQFGEFILSDNEITTILDIPIPDKPLDAWLYNGKKLTPNPAYTEPLLPRDLLAEIDELRARLNKAGVD